MPDLQATRKALVTEIDELEFRHRGDLNPLTADERERMFAAKRELAELRVQLRAEAMSAPARRPTTQMWDDDARGGVVYE